MPEPRPRLYKVRRTLASGAYMWLAEPRYRDPEHWAMSWIDDRMDAEAFTDKEVAAAWVVRARENINKECLFPGEDAPIFHCVVTCP